MTTFDRLRPRDAAAGPSMRGLHDAEGKRALFSSASSTLDQPTIGIVTVECSRCGERTVMSPLSAVRAAFPSLLLSVGLGRGDRESTLGVVSRRRYGAFLRCPACHRATWTRLTLHL